LRRGRTIGWLAAAVVVSACSRPEPPAPPPAAATTPAPAPASGAGRIVGKVQGGGIAIVVLAPKGARTFPPQEAKPVMDQANLTFTPELLLVRTGQAAEFRNSDDVLHNVNVKHEETREQAFNVAIPTGGSYDHTFGREGFYRVGCDGNGRVDLRVGVAVCHRCRERRQLRVRRGAAGSVDRDRVCRRPAHAEGR